MAGSIHPRISVSGISALRGSLEQDIAILNRKGVGALGVLYGKAEADPAAALALLRASNLEFSCVTASCQGANLIAPADDLGSPALRVLKPSIDFAAALGGRPCYFTAGVTPPRMPTDDAFDALVAALPPVLAYGEEMGVPLALEHSNVSLRDNGFVNSLRDTIELSELTGIGVCLELQNCWTERHLPELFRTHVDRFLVVQVSDYCVGESPRMNRRVLGDGSMPLEWLLGHLLDAGFAGYFEIETLGPAIEAEGYEATISRNVDWLNERLVTWGA